jgi:origin recognition complex subunit 5
MQALKSKFIGREAQIDQLVALFGQPSDHVPPLIVHGQTATGKSTLLTDLMQGLGVKSATVHCAECYSKRLLFESILLQLQGSQTQCDDMSVFIKVLSEICTEEQTTYLVRGPFSLH